MTIENRKGKTKVKKNPEFDKFYKIITPKAFSDLLDKILSNAQSTLNSKGEDYWLTADTMEKFSDTMENFNTAARANNQNPAVALWGMASKHLSSVIKMIRDIEKEDKIPSEEYVSEKVGDLRNYLILLEIILFQERAKRSQ